MTRETLYQDEDVHFLCDKLFEGRVVAMHLNITPGAWSPAKFKRYRSIFTEIIVPSLKSQNYHEVYATPIETDKKAQKLIKMFGLVTFGQNMGLTLMKREI